MDELVTATKSVLVDIVKKAQRGKMKGAKGEWKEFLNAYDSKFGASLSDPSKKSTEVLVAFLKTFADENDIKFFVELLQCHSNREAVEGLTKKSSNESPEQKLVRLTLEHPHYSSDYAFPSHEEGWVVTKLGKMSKVLRSNEMVAVDCEMVECEDGSEALVKVCVVDRNLKVKLNELVKPNGKVVDYRTEITGLAAKDLEGVACSLPDIQKSMKTILKHGTILIGHSLNNDLQALKLSHARVIDTSYVFRRPDQIRRRPSLNSLCKLVLGCEVRKEGDPHNCLDDARAAMKLVLAKIEPGFDDEAKTWVPDDAPEIDMAKLFLHGIPIEMPSDEVQKVITGEFNVEVQSVKPGRKRYAVVAVFKSPQEAHKAFENVEADSEKDTNGLPQKCISYQRSNGETVKLYVRKTAHSDPASQGLKKRLCEVDASLGESKKLKTEGHIESQCDEHVNEIERLKRELSQRDEEISNLHKIIASLARKGGL